MLIKVFGRADCLRTRRLMCQLRYWVGEWEIDQPVSIRFVDLQTPRGLAAAAWHQLEGELPAILVEMKAVSNGLSESLLAHLDRGLPVKTEFYWGSLSRN